MFTLSSRRKACQKADEQYKLNVDIISNTILVLTQPITEYVERQFKNHKQFNLTITTRLYFKDKIK